MTINSDFSEYTPKDTLEETVALYNFLRPHTGVKPSDKAMKSLSETYGKKLVAAAVQDRTSPLARTFVENDKTRVSVSYRPCKKRNAKKEKALNESLQKQFQSVFSIPCSDDVIDRIKTLITDRQDSDIYLSENKRPDPDMSSYTTYFKRIKEIASLKNEGVNERNDYEKALELVETLPFLASYVHGHSTLDNSADLRVEFDLRHRILKKIHRLDHEKKDLLKILVSSFPHSISTHFRLAKATAKKMSLHNCIRHLNLAGLALGKEVQTMHRLFIISRKALQNPRRIALRTSTIPTTNAIYIGGKTPGKIVLKAFENLKQYQYEIAAYEMSEIGGFSDFTLPMKRCRHISTSFNKRGDITQAPVEFHKNSGPLIALPYLECSSGHELLIEIANKVNATQSLWSIFSVQSFGSPRTDSYRKEIEPFLTIPSFSFETAILKSFVLGDQDGVLTNYLFTKENTLFSIDHERIMPENNQNVSVTKSNAVEAKFDNNSLIFTKWRHSTLTNICPINCALIGFPQANQPFSSQTIKHVLANLRIDNFKEYHSRKKLFSDEQVTAQFKRISLVRKLFKAENKKSIITLTPRALYLELVGKHETYRILKDEYHLTDFYLFAQLGKIPGNVNSPQVVAFAQKLKAFGIRNKAETQLALINKAPFRLARDKDIENPLFGSANSAIELEGNQSFQAQMSQDDGLYYLLTGIKREPESQPAIKTRLKPIPPFRF